MARESPPDAREAKLEDPVKPAGAALSARGTAAAAVVVLALGAAIAIAGAAPGSPATATAAGAETRWLCRPGLADNPCTRDRTATVVTSTGATSIQEPTTGENPIDCFYVYPTVSNQPTANANLHVDPVEKAIATRQASRFSRGCRVFAPMYRQALSGGNSYTAYGGVLRAWRTYLNRFNHGRGVVLIGHSQGSFMLIKLIEDRIDSRPWVRKRLVSALLLGGNVTVRKGSEVGGSFEHVPACRSRVQTGCVVAYSTFNQTPPQTSLFGRVPGPFFPWTGGDPTTNKVLCVNPAALAGGSGALHPYFTTTPFPGVHGFIWDTYDTPPSAPTPWVTFPELYTARCVHANGASWLQIDDIGGAGDSRSRVEVGALGPDWGLHVFDDNLALGDLVSLVKAEAEAYVTPPPRPASPRGASR